MPFALVPVLVWLANLLATIISVVIGFLLQIFTKRLALVAIVLAGIGTLVIAFFAAIIGIVNIMSPQLHPLIIQGASLFLPNNVPLILSSIMTARVLRFAYEWNVKFLQMKL